MKSWLFALWTGLVTRSYLSPDLKLEMLPGDRIDSGGRLRPIKKDWRSLSEEQQREEIVQLYALAVCHRGNLPWADAADECLMMGRCDACRRIADAFVDVEKVMRSEVMR
jgi:hypothetical protein